MRFRLPERGSVPECEIYVEIIQKGTQGVGELGRKRPVMFMLPGGPGGNHTVYDAIKTSLANFADLVLIDPRGCGLSSKSNAHVCTMENSVDDVDAIRKALGLKKFILFGGSYGAMVSLSYAIAYPEYLSGLILVVGAPSGKCYETALETLKKIGTNEQIEITKRLFNGEIDTVEEQQKYYSLMRNIYLAKAGEQLESEKIPTVGKRIPYFIELNNVGHATILPNYDVTKNLHKIKAPALLIAGKHDWINNVEYAYQMHELIPNSQLVVFPEAGHFVWKGVEEQFFQKIGAYIKDKIINGSVVAS